MNTSAADIPTAPYTHGVADVRGSMDISSMDWDLLTRKQPENVSKWIAYLHRYEYRDASKKLLGAISRSAIDGTSYVYPFLRHPLWEVFETTGLPGVLMDIVSEPGMFSDNPDAFKVG